MARSCASEPGLLADARVAQAYLAARGDVDPAQLVYFGGSLGAAVAVQLAVERPPMALVLRSPFTSLADVARLHDVPAGSASSCSPASG
jgi:alpha/beta superfamily hydrolase